MNKNEKFGVKYQATVMILALVLTAGCGLIRGAWNDGIDMKDNSQDITVGQLAGVWQQKDY